MDLELVKTEANSAANHGTEYRKIHPLGKIPAFEGANGFNLSEVMAIAIYGKLLTAVYIGFYALFHPFVSAPCYMMRCFNLVIPVRTTLLITHDSDSREIEYPAHREKNFRASTAYPPFLEHIVPLAFLIA